MKKLLVTLMLLASPLLAVDAWVDVQNTSASDLYLYQIDQGEIDVYFLKDSEPIDLSGDVTFWYGTNGLRSEAVVEITNNIPVATNVVSIPVTSDKFGLVSTRPFSWGIDVDGKMQGDGRLYVKVRPAISNVVPTFVNKTYWDFSTITNYVGVSVYGPYIWGTGFAYTTNATGQLTITSTAATPSWDDVTDKPTTFQPTSDYRTSAATDLLLDAKVGTNDAAYLASLTDVTGSGGVVVTGSGRTRDIDGSAFVQTELDPLVKSYMYDGADVTITPTNEFEFNGSGIITGYSGTNATVVVPYEIGGVEVTGIGGFAFSFDMTISEIIFPKSVTEVAVSQFFHCSNVVSVIIPSVKYLGDGMFRGCASLTSLTVPELTKLGDRAIYDCPLLRSIALPAITNIGCGGFYNCNGLTAVYFSGDQAPTTHATCFINSTNITNYVLNPIATGWGATLRGQPVVRSDVYADAFVAGSAGTQNVITPDGLEDISGLLSAALRPEDVYTTRQSIPAAVITNGYFNASGQTNSEVRIAENIGAVTVTVDSESSDGSERFACTFTSGTNSITWPTTNIAHFSWDTGYDAPTSSVARTAIFISEPYTTNTIGRWRAF